MYDDGVARCHAVQDTFSCVCVCEREGASECMRGLVYSDMHTHRVHGMWVRAGACVQIRVTCVWESVFVYMRV